MFHVEKGERPPRSGFLGGNPKNEGVEKPGVPPDESSRLRAIEQLRILDTPAEKVWDRLVHLAAAICDVPIALVTVVDAKRQWFKANVGLDVSETSREVSFCGHAIWSDDMFVVPDASEDERFADNPLVTEAPHIRFYAGQPINAPDGNKIGTLCVIDRQPRRLTSTQAASMKLLAQQAEDLLIMRESIVTLRNLVEEDPDITTQSVLNRISHDLATPLTPILLRLASLRKLVAGNADAVTALASIEDNVNRLRMVLRQTTEALLGAPEPNDGD